MARIIIIGVTNMWSLIRILFNHVSLKALENAGKVIIRKNTSFMWQNVSSVKGV